jgi:hypothetical protein
MNRRKKRRGRKKSRGKKNPTSRKMQGRGLSTLETGAVMGARWKREHAETRKREIFCGTKRNGKH